MVTLLRSVVEQLKWLVAPGEMARLRNLEREFVEARRWLASTHPMVEDTLLYLENSVVNGYTTHPMAVRESLQRRFPEFGLRDVDLLKSIVGSVTSDSQPYVQDLHEKVYLHYINCTRTKENDRRKRTDRRTSTD